MTLELMFLFRPSWIKSRDGRSVVGLGGFLTLAYDSMKKTIEALEAAGSVTKSRS